MLGICTRGRKSSNPEFYSLKLRRDRKGEVPQALSSGIQMVDRQTLAPGARNLIELDTNLSDTSVKRNSEQFSLVASRSKQGVKGFCELEENLPDIPRPS
jgi:hypothetical protein